MTETLVTSAAELQLLSAQSSAVLRMRHIRLAFTKVPAEEQRLWQKRLDDDLKDCGCTLGGLFASAGMLMVVFFSIVNWSFLLAAPVRSLMLMLLTLVACAATGKIIGLALARGRFRRTLSSIIARVS